MKFPGGQIWTLLLVCIALVGGYVALVNSSHAELFTNMDLLVQRIRDSAYLGPLLIISLMAIAVVFNPLPSAPIALAAGAAYGHTTGTLYVVLGAEIGALIAFCLARIAGYELLRKYLGDKLSLGRCGSQNALTAMVFVSRLIPFMSFDLVSYAAGLTALKFWRFALATLLGLMPVSFVLAHLGSEAVAGDSSQLLFIVLLLGLLTALPLIWAWFRQSHTENPPDPQSQPEGPDHD